MSQQKDLFRRHLVNNEKMTIQEELTLSSQEDRWPPLCEALCSNDDAG